MYRIRCRPWCVWAGIAALFTGSIYCQESVSYGGISGTVDDPSGSPMANVRVTASAGPTGQTFRSSTDERGRFRFSYLPLGPYQVTGHRDGFQDEIREVTLTVGAAVTLPLHLSIAGEKQSVEVVSETSPLETTRSEVSARITPREVRQLPLDGRNYLDLALLLPGVSRTNTGSTQRFAETSAVPGTGISIGSQRNLANTFVVDGLSANDDAAGLAGTFYGQEVIREFQVINSGATVEFGRALGGVVNIVTESGSNTLHGGAYEFFRNQRLDARNALAANRLPLTQNQFGGTLGGPVLKDRLFFFGNYEGTRQNTAGVITIFPTYITSINTRLANTGYGGQPVTTGEYPTTLRTNNYFAKLDGRFNDRDQFNVRFSRYDVGSENSRNVGGLSTVSRGANLYNHDTTVAVNNVATITPVVVNETRFQFTRSRLSAPVNDLVGPAVNISGVANFGTAGFSPTARYLDLYELVDNVAVQKGAHSFKVGADFSYNDLSIIFPGNQQGQYTFSSLANFLAGRYINFQQAFGPAEQPQKNPNIGVYGKDEWRLHSSLTLNLGLRYDYQSLPSIVPNNRSNLAPRIGVAWSPDKARRTVLRANYGLFYDRIPLRAVSNALQRGGLQYRTALLTPAQFGAPIFPAVLPGFPDGVLTNITTIDPNIENGYSQQASFEAQRQIGKEGSLSVAYQHLRGLHLLLSQNQNVPRCATGFNLCRPDSSFGNNSQYRSLGDSYFDGLLVAWNQRPSSWLNYRVSYTYSKAIDDLGQFFFSSPQNNFNIAGDRSLSDNDQRHRLTFSGTVQSPAQSRWLRNFALSTILTYNSALPFNVQTGSDNNGDTNTNDRPAGLGRNTGRGFYYLGLDARLSRTFQITERLRLESLVEGFNAINRVNKLLPNNIFGNGTYPGNPAPGFGIPTAAGSGREVQIALRLRF